MRTFLLLLAAAFAALLPAQDDRDRTTPVESQWLTSRTENDLLALQGDGWRFTDIEVTSTFPLSFAVAMVKNTGAYAKTWAYRSAATPADLSALVAQGMRIVDLQPYSALAGLRFAAVLVANVGADAKTWWWWYDQTSTQVDANIAAVNGRLTSFKRYTDNGQSRFATVVVSNTGSDYRPWAYLYASTSAALNQFAAQNTARVYGIERVADDSYDVILIDNQQALGHWFYYEQSTFAAQQLLEQNLGRVVDVSVYTVGTFPLQFTRCCIAMLDKANPLENTARQAFYGAASGGLGQYGFFLKQVNGPVLAQMRADSVFEPGDTMKTLYHVHVMRRVAQGTASLSTLHNKPTSCGVPGSGQSYGTSLTQMMTNNDDMATLALSQTFGVSFIQGTADALGMTSTNINYTIGCAGPAPINEMTLRDLSTLHEQVANGYLAGGLVNVRPTFYALMQESLAFPTWGTSDLDDRIDIYALVTGMSVAARDVFKSKLKIAYKHGDALWLQGSTVLYAYSEGGWMSVPFRASNGLLAPKEYTFGAFDHAFSAQPTSGRNAMCNAELELVWDRVKAAMDTWDDYTAGSITPLGGAGCPGSAGVPVQTVGGQPDLEETVLYTIESAPASAIAIAVFGFSSTSWAGAPLPADLAPIGAPGCILRTEPSLMLAAVTGGTGVARLPIVIGTDPATIGTVWYSQFLVLDPPANAFGATLSNALRTRVGGSD
ncbi:MAG: serine hydrolase [Planctomycetes bacterium]|nr:serine hydrolase [Planctomycetota bacterium]